MINKNYYYTRVTQQALIGAFLVSIVCIVLDVYWLSSIGIGAFTYYSLRLLLELGEDIPVESFLLSIASMQWIVAPVLTYAGLTDHWKYYMYVPEDRYMALVVPAVILFSIGLYIFRAKNRVEIYREYQPVIFEILSSNKNLPIYLIGVGFIFSMILRHVPQTLSFPAYLLSNLHYIGLIYLVSSGGRKNKLIILFIAFTISFLSALRSGYFHDFLLWNAFIGMYVAYRFKPTLKTKLLWLVMGALFIFVIQAVKVEYREKLHLTGSGDALTKFTDTVGERFQYEGKDESNVERIIIRLNQGWIISILMERVPELLPYASGETVAVALMASILPRFLFPDKPEAGGRKNYEKYTGFNLWDSTSMGISTVGEAYINFGTEGAWVFMLFLGAIFSLILRWLFFLVRKFPTIWLWSPLILLHFVKAETELLVQLNFLVKSIVVVILFLYFNKRFLKIRL